MDMWKKAWLTMVVVESDDILHEQGAMKLVAACGKRKKHGRREKLKREQKRLKKG